MTFQLSLTTASAPFLAIDSALAQHAEGLPLPPRPLLLQEEIQALNDYIGDERYWWVSIQMLSWEDCMTSKGHDPNTVHKLSSDEVESVLGPNFNRDFFTASRKLRYHRAVIALLNESCHLPPREDIQQTANRMALQALKTDADRMEKFVIALRAENERLIEENRLKQAMKASSYCSQEIGAIANNEKARLYSVALAMQGSIGYSAANQMLNNIVTKYIFEKHQCVPVLRPMPFPHF